MLGRCYEYGIKKDLDKSLQLYKLANDSDSIVSMATNISPYNNNLIRCQFKLYKLATKMNNISAVIRLAYMYQDYTNRMDRSNELFYLADHLIKQGYKYDNGVHSILSHNFWRMKDYKLGCYHYALSNEDEDYEFRQIILLHHIPWTITLHNKWFHNCIEGRNIVLTLLLISKYRSISKYNIINSIMIKGITLRVIKYYADTIINSDWVDEEEPWDELLTGIEQESESSNQLILTDSIIDDDNDEISINKYIPNNNDEDDISSSESIG
jgi:hypothetical protein